ncbi:MAG: NAD(P)H-dependent glycerol-3-phosphate dehydrogenase, partial [Anaerolineales bacterium]|nr:NAD(P)H-dependent glycerol-3-phosphate dehydrogenase [Anaerolineales bacterium]
VSEQLFPTTIIGAGMWGTALAIAIARKGNDVLLWGRDTQHLVDIVSSHGNKYYLPGIKLPDTLRIEPNFDKAITVAKHVLVSVPSIAFDDILQKIKPLLADGVPFSWATKGLIPGTGSFLLDAATAILGSSSHALAVVSGPSFAVEVAKDLPTAIIVASRNESFAQGLASALHSRTLRAYTSHDVLGVQIGGAVKNVLAIGAGISDGLGYGANARAALITRGMAEILRFAVRLGAQKETMFGLSGMGDLILTCTDNQSRNRQLGLAIGHGLTVSQSVAKVGKTVEGMCAAQEVLRRARQVDVEMPIVEQIYKILFEGNDPLRGVIALLCREPKAEDNLPL